MFGITEKSYKLILDYLASQTFLYEVYIFGSRAVGNYRQGSDIDLVVMSPNLSDDLIQKLNYDLNEVLLIPYFVDVLNYQSIDNEHLKQEIDKKAVLFFKSK